MAIAALDVEWPGLRDRLCDPGPAIREHINVFVDGEPADLATSVRPGSTVHVIPAVAGG
jgi:molybdopterin converting factor small subunit